MAASENSSGTGLLPSARQATQKAGNPLLKAGQEAKLRQATRMWEAHFLSTLWKEMRKSSPKSGLVHGGYGEELFTGLLDQARSEAMATRGSLGIAELLQSQLSRADRVKSPSASASAGRLNPLGWSKTAPAGDQAAPESANPPGDDGMSDAGLDQPLVDLPPLEASGQAVGRVTLPMPQGEDEESATTAWPSPPADAAPLAPALNRGAQAGQPAAQEMDLPVQGAVTSTFGLRLHPITGDIRPHQGLDLAAPEGTPIQAAMGGVVRFAGNGGDYGRLVVIEHDDGSSTFYGHCKTLSVTPGQRVAQGQMVARVGMTGLATGPHLHFEVRDGSGRAVDPLPMLAGRLNPSS